MYTILLKNITFKYFAILAIVNAVSFFACDANIGDSGSQIADDNSQIGDNGSQINDLCVGADVSSGILSLDGENYRIITDQVGLEAMSNDLAATYILCDDISLDNIFAQINPSNEGVGFTGTLEGNNKTISELRIQADRHDVGLFGVIGLGGEVRNLHVSLVDGNGINPSVSGADNVGALVGRNNGTIKNVCVTGGYVKGNNAIGGLVGFNNGIINDSYVTSDVEGNNNIGGAIGYNDETITHSYATGSVTGANFYTGGLVGYNSGGVTRSYFDAITTGRPSMDQLGIPYYSHSDGKVYTAADGGGRKIIEDDFSGWDFDAMWTLPGEGKWPILQFQN